MGLTRNGNVSVRNALNVRLKINDYIVNQCTAVFRHGGLPEIVCSGTGHGSLNKWQIRWKKISLLEDVIDVQFLILTDDDLHGGQFQSVYYDT